MIINKKVLIGALAVAMILTFYGILALNGYTYQKSTSGQATAYLTVIPAKSIPTTDLASQFTTATATIDPNIGNLNGIAVGKYVQVTGTSGVGLNVHEEAGKASNTVFIAVESEVFHVINGPVEKDNIVWWQIATPYDDTRKGWAAADYLTVIEE